MAIKIFSAKPVAAAIFGLTSAAAHAQADFRYLDQRRIEKEIDINSLKAASQAHEIKQQQMEIDRKLKEMQEDMDYRRRGMEPPFRIGR